MTNVNNLASDMEAINFHPNLMINFNELPS